MEKHNRFKGLPWYNRSDVPVLLGGCGGIGSWTAMLLTRAGFKVTVIDFDIIEATNLGGQLFFNNSLGISKVEGIFKIASELSDSSEFIIIKEKVDKNTFTNKIVITAFDNMEARRNMYNKWLSFNSGNEESIFIDPRLEAEHLFIYTIRGTDYDRMDDYEANHLKDDSEVAEAECTAKQTSHVAAIIAGTIVSILTNHITNMFDIDRLEVRSVPYKVEQFMPLVLSTITDKP